MSMQQLSGSSEARDRSSFIAYCYSINYVLGVGVLSLPYGFSQAGWLLSSITMLVVSFFSWMCVSWVPEIMARAEAITSFLEREDNLSPLLDECQLEGAHGDENPKYRIRSGRKFEFSSLCRLFLSRRWEKLYMFFFVFNFIAALWSLGIVFASSMASNIPVPFLNDGVVCDVEKDMSQGCQNIYLFYLLMFIPIAVFLSCLELREQTVIQVVLSLFRFAVMAAMIITSLSGILNASSSASSAAQDGAGKTTAAAWKPAGLLSLVPLAVYANILAHSIPGISHIANDKRQLGTIFKAVFSTIFLGYTILSIIVSIYYGTSVDKLCTLSWRSYSGSAWVADFIVLFPAIDAFSCFPLMSVTYGNNLLALLLNRPDEANRKTIILFRLIAAIPPLIAAAFVRNIDNVLTWCGLFALQIAYTFPALLQYASIIRCEQVFGQGRTRTMFSGAFSGTYGIIAGLAFSGAAVIFVLISSVKDL